MAKKFDSLSEDDKKILTECYYDKKTPLVERLASMASKYKVGSRTVNRWWAELGITKKMTANVPQEKEDLLKSAFERKLGDKKYLLISSAQNATPIHENGFSNMLKYAEFLDADIHVIPFRYKNPTSVFKEAEEDWWSRAVVPYLDLARHKVAANLEILSDVRTQPTAAYPLRGLEGITGGASCIIGHPKMHLQTLPVLEGEHKKILYTSGAITVENYTDSLAGKKGEFHHTFGFVIVEIDGDSFHVRQVPMADDGSFIDLCFEVNADGVHAVDTCEALVLGDIHCGDTDLNKMRASETLTEMVIPEHIILHDIFNGHSINPHEAHNGIIRFDAFKRGRLSLEKEVDQMLEFLKDLQRDNPKSKLVVVKSNHDDFLDRYIRDQDWKKDIANAGMFAKCLGILLSGNGEKGLIPYFIEDEFSGKVIPLDRDDSFKPGEVQYAYHGDMGVNGSRGSVLQYSRLSTKTVIGHGHHAERINGCLMAGTSTFLRVGYNKGGSNWVHADVITHKNRKSQHVIYDENYKFTTFFDRFSEILLG